MNKRILEQAFAYFDIDNSDTITFKEVSQFLDEDDEYVERIFREIDENGDGVINREEFINLILKGDIWTRI